MSELASQERTVYLDRLNARESMVAMPASPEAARAELLALIAAEEERLEAALAGHLEREEALAAVEQAFDDSAWGERLRKYEVSCDKTLLRIIETLRKRQREADGTGSPGGRAAFRAGSSPPRTAESPEGRASAPAEPAPAEEATPSDDRAPVPAESSSLEEAMDDGTAEFGLTEEEIQARALRIAQVVGLAPVATGTVEVPPSIDPDSQDPTDESSRRAAPARMLANAVLALFAMFFLTGLAAASARSSIEPPKSKPDRPMGRVFALTSSDRPRSAWWLCSSRSPDEAVPVLGEACTVGWVERRRAE